MRKISSMNLAIIIGAVAVIGIAIAAFFMSPQKPAASNVSTGGRIEASETSFDFGRVPNTPSSYHNIKFKNSGSGPLKLTGAYTSCGCTSVIIKLPKEDSPRFEMHNNPTDWSGELKAGEEAMLEIKFDPIAHGIKGQVSRTIMLFSNDPKEPQKEFSFSADVYEVK